MKKESVRYQKMLDEVEKIIQEVSQPDIDLDDMVKKVEKGYDLIQTMKGRLDETKTRIEDLQKRFESSTTEASIESPS